MIDIHSHVIPEVDDGSRSLNETINMIRKINEKGVKTLVATPHYTPEMYEFPRDEIEMKVDFLNRILKTNDIDTKILLGQEIMIDINTFDLLKDGIIGPINDTRYVLIEFDMDIAMPNIDYIIKRIINKGFIPIIAHPERYKYVSEDINIAKKWVQNGALLQMNLGSISGVHGTLSKKTIIKLLKEDLIHLWGSDIHYFRPTYDNFDEHIKLIRKVVKNEKQADEILIHNNSKVISNEIIEPFKLNVKKGLFK